MRVIVCWISLLILCTNYWCNGEFINFKSNILGPAMKNKPFLNVWNVASEYCSDKFGIDLGLQKFEIVENPNKSWFGDDIMIFYDDMFGYFPRYDDNTQKPIHGGLPQNGIWQNHVSKSLKDIKHFIPDVNFRGLAVIDMEHWHPLFDRMGWGIFKKYQTASIKKVEEEHKNWNSSAILKEAQKQYEYSSRLYMESSLEIGKYQRPQGLWGFYLYPDCYNYNTFQSKYPCTNGTQQLNDKIQWLFDSSTAIYPSVYISQSQSDNYTTYFYSYNRIAEALRLDANRPSKNSIPVFPYHGIVYRLSNKYLSLQDLHESIGVAALLGTSGMVIWGDHYRANSTETCTELKSYINDVLGPYCKHLSDSARDCSLNYCSGHGRCVVAPLSGEKRLLSKTEALEIISTSKPNPVNYEKILELGYSITCQCFEQWKGTKCETF